MPHGDSNIIPSMGAPVVKQKNTPCGMFYSVPLRGFEPLHTRWAQNRSSRRKSWMCPRKRYLDSC